MSRWPAAAPPTIPCTMCGRPTQTEKWWRAAGSPSLPLRRYGTRCGACQSRKYRGSMNVDPPGTPKWRRWQEAEEMHDDLQLGLPEIARQMGVTEQTVHGHLKRARKEREAS